MLVDHGTELQARMRERMQEAERQRLAARAGPAGTVRYRLRQARKQLAAALDLEDAP
jgi:hypothetical protein